MTAPNALSNSVLLIGGAIAQKVIVFAVNQVSLSFTSPEVVGKASIQLELWLATCLFISREAIRISCLRYSLRNDSASKRYFTNMTWLPTVLVIVISAVLLFFQRRSAEFSSSSLVYFIYSGAAVVESLGEPWYNLYNNQMYIEPRVRAETLGYLVKSLVTLYAAAYSQWGVLGFGFAQFSFAAVYVTVLLSYFPHFRRNQSSASKIVFSWTDMLPSVVQPTNLSKFSIISRVFDYDMLKTSVILSCTSVVKHLLTEADKISLTLYCTDRDQGIYAITNNYGSLVARMVYLPLEDATRLSLSKLTTQKQEAKQLLKKLLKVVLVLGVGIAALGPAYVDVFVKFAVRTTWDKSTVSFSLVCYCYYLCVLGINGIAEAYLQVSATSDQYLISNVGMILSSFAFTITAWQLVGSYGGAGIIVANIAGTAVRGFWNSHCIQGSFDDKKGLFNSFYFLWSIVPHMSFWIVVLVVKVVSTVSKNTFLSDLSTVSMKSILCHLAVGVSCGLLYLAGVILTSSAMEKQEIMDIVIWKRRPTKTD